MGSAARFTHRPGDLVVGVLGGMGPLATVDFMARLVHLTPADKDWDHLHVIVDSNPRIPSRTRAILYGEESPAPHLAEGARRLEALGAGFIAVPCNSAAYYLSPARAAVAIPVIDPVVATAEAVRASGVQRPLVMGGMVTYRAGLYARALSPLGVAVVTPTDAEQDRVAALIESLKQLDVSRAVVESARTIVTAGLARGADSVILGCTEFGLIAQALATVLDVALPVFNSNELLARATVDRARAGWRGIAISTRATAGSAAPRR